MKHTPTPWMTNGGKSLFAQSKQIALMRASNSGWLNNQPCASEEEANANAAYIVRAVNCHEELFQALKSVVDYLPEGDGQYVSHLRSIIAKAEGESK